MKAMLKKIIKYIIDFFKLIMDWYEMHPYIYSFIFSILIISYFLFNVPPVETADDAAAFDDEIIIVDIDKIHLHKRVAKKEYSLEEKTSSTNIQNVERAMGTSDDVNAIDLAFYQADVEPRLIGRLKKLHPKIAKEMNIEATVNTELLIGLDGKVKRVIVLGVRLSKTLPPRLSDEIIGRFFIAAKKTLLGVQFTPAVISGKITACKKEYIIKFELK